MPESNERSTKVLGIRQILVLPQSSGVSPVVTCENKVSNAESLMPDVLLPLGNSLHQNESDNETGMNVENLLLE